MSIELHTYGFRPCDGCWVGPGSKQQQHSRSATCSHLHVSCAVRQLLSTAFQRLITHLYPLFSSPSYGSGSWGTLANIFFLFSALFTDVLHVRVMLVLAYVCVCLQVSLGFPSPTWWGRNPQASTLQLGNILWFSVTLALQVSCGATVCCVVLVLVCWHTLSDCRVYVGADDVLAHINRVMN